MHEGSNGPVMRRHVFFAAGYHPMAVEDHFKVFTREAARFGAVWSAAVTSDPAPTPNGTGAFWHISAEGANWRTETTFELLAWDDIARRDMARSTFSHLKGSVWAVVDMIASGTLARYFRASRRYGLFFVSTYAALALIWLVAAAMGTALALDLAPRIGGPAALVAGVATALCAGLLLLRWPGRRLKLKQSLDLAEFSVAFAHGRLPDLDGRVEAFADRIAQVVAAGEVDEVVLAGHSLGATHLVSALAHILKGDPAFGQGVPVRLLTLGSTTAKFALHPAGARLRQAAEEVAAASAIGWLEIQSRDDVVSFYKVNPVTLDAAEVEVGHTVPGDYSARPLVRHAAIRDMVTPTTFNRFRFDMMRRHCQCFLAGDKRAHHDFHAYVCGPAPFDALAADTSGLLAYVDAEGRLFRLPPTTTPPPIRS